MQIKKPIKYFSKRDLFFWYSSVIIIVVSFLAFDRANYLTLFASLIGTTSLIFNAKGNPFGQFLMIIFSVMYGIISYSFSYYGEMITYLGMTAPLALCSLISWLRNPYDKSKSEVKVETLGKNEIAFMFALSAIVTVIFYFVLSAFNTANIIPSTLSVTTSFIAAYLTFRRSAFFALAYAANDIILIILWIMATKENTSYLSVVICFLIFLINDIYGYLSWLQMERRQRA